MIMTLFIITMFFGGGLIPTYLVVKQLGMLDTIWALVIPGAVSVWNIILARTFFRSLPKELNEAAKIDGGSDIMIFLGSSYRFPNQSFLSLRSTPSLVTGTISFNP